MTVSFRQPLPLLDNDILRTFVAIAETGNFSTAAEVVFRTPSAVSMQIKKLEEQLKTTLFLRDAGKMLEPNWAIDILLADWGSGKCGGLSFVPQRKKMAREIQVLRAIHFVLCAAFTWKQSACACCPSLAIRYPSMCLQAGLQGHAGSVCGAIMRAVHVLFLQGGITSGMTAAKPVMGACRGW